jgi:hypothetical protein
MYICRGAAGVDKENVESPAVKLGNLSKLYVMRAGILTQLSMAFGSEMISRDIRLSSLINFVRIFHFLPEDVECL